MRTVFFSEESRIRDLSLKLKALYSIFPEEKKKHTEGKDYVYLSVAGQSRGKKLSHCIIEYMVKKYTKNLKIKKKVKPHTFRHSNATSLLSKGAEMRMVQILLGHRSITTTQMYTHLSEGVLRQTAQLLYR
ncbi:MAG: tyrosine-type recombinase/integrase [Candidatus Peribacteria bacterium]|jgi:integrase/recombinase XerD|nr:tyrosine-type recombinase/integrase [Candidatus Peribacteria bacterium]